MTLDQMAPNSPLLEELKSSPDPGVAYRVIAGNTKLLAVPGDEKNDKARLFAQIVCRLAPRRLLHDMTSLAFFGQPNDIAVSVDSITSVPAGRVPNPLVVGCDHMTYFATESGQKALAEALD